MSYVSEYPRPQLKREEWFDLCGEWDFDIVDPNLDNDNEVELKRKINVPFCPESSLSGIGERGFMKQVRYKREFTLPDNFAGKRVIIHFGAVDYEAAVYINGKYAGSHKGGYTPFSFDITDLLSANNVLYVCVKDDCAGGEQPTGKQSHREESFGCFYTRTTGIWQTVWLEAVDAAHVVSWNVVCDISSSMAHFKFETTNECEGMIAFVNVEYDGRAVGFEKCKVHCKSAEVPIRLSELHLWEIGQGRLYNITVTLTDTFGILHDSFSGYFGMREVGLDGKGMTLNGKHFFGRYVLDQGYYPDGIYTAPNDECLRNDIISAQKLGFNGARLHQKVFEPRYLFWADKLGFLVWGEFPSWGLNITRHKALDGILAEWIEVLKRDMAHPCIIGWCPFNETWDGPNGERQCDSILESVYRATKDMDPTRPVIDTSGNFHVVTDIFDVHDYEQDVMLFKSYYSRIDEGILLDQIERGDQRARQKYNGGPVFVSEYGGIKWSKSDNAWGYGKEVVDENEFIDRYAGLTDVLLCNKNIFAFCYTQLYDVEQECNGLMTYDRKFKFDPEIIKKINSAQAAVEE